LPTQRGWVFFPSGRITLQETNISPKRWHVEDDFPFPKVGYVNPLEGTVIDHRAFVFVFSGSSYTKWFFSGRIEVVLMLHIDK